MTLRPLPTLLAILLLGASAASASGWEITRVWTGWRDAADFARIAETVTGVEQPLDGPVFRSREHVRAGFYWLVRLDGEAPAGAPITLRLQWVTSGDTEARTLDFSTTHSPGGGPYHIGLTGGDCPTPGERPVAWRIAVLDADHNELASRQSALWCGP